MAAEQFITSAYAAIVSWTYILLTILLIVKIVQFFTGGGAGWPWGGKGKYDDSGRTRDDISPDDKRRREEDEKSGKSEGLDVENPGLVQVIVLDEDDNPIQGAKVSITPARMHKRRWLRTKKEWVRYGGLTSPDGVWPGGGKPENVGSGTVTVTVSKRNFFVGSWFRFGRYYQKKDYEIIGKEKHDIVVIMKRKGEKAEWFEPKILEIKPVDEKIMRVKGIIK
jgi:nitrogen fixation-related uncharacterized protein